MDKKDTPYTIVNGHSLRVMMNGMWICSSCHRIFDEAAHAVLKSCSDGWTRQKAIS